MCDFTVFYKEKNVAKLADLFRHAARLKSARQYDFKYATIRWTLINERSMFMITCLSSADLISSELSAPWLVAATVNRVVRCVATQFAAAATSHDHPVRMKEGQMRWSEIDFWYESYFTITPSK